MQARYKHVEIWGKSRAVQKQAFIERIENGMSEEEAINTPKGLKPENSNYDMFLSNRKQSLSRSNDVQ